MPTSGHGRHAETGPLPWKIARDQNRQSPEVQREGAKRRENRRLVAGPKAQAFMTKPRETCASEGRPCTSRAVVSDKGGVGKGAQIQPSLGALIQRVYSYAQCRGRRLGLRRRAERNLRALAQDANLQPGQGDGRTCRPDCADRYAHRFRRPPFALAAWLQREHLRPAAPVSAQGQLPRWAGPRRARLVVARLNDRPRKTLD